jgi:hypothetical protein
MDRRLSPFPAYLLLLIAGGTGLAATGARRELRSRQPNQSWGQYFIVTGGYWADRPAEYRKELKRHHSGGRGSPTWDPTACNHFAWTVVSNYDREFEQGGVHRQWQYVNQDAAEWEHGIIQKDQSNLRFGDLIFTADLGHVGLYEVKGRPKPTISASLGGRLPQWRGWWPKYRYYARAKSGSAANPAGATTGGPEKAGKPAEGAALATPGASSPQAATSAGSPSPPGTSHRLAGVHDRPLVLWYVGDSGDVHKKLISATVDVGKRRLGNAPVEDLIFARWQPSGTHLAVDLDSGIEVCRYPPATRKFTAPRSMSKALGGGRSYTLPFTYSGVAWSPDGQSLLVDYGERGIERVDLRTGARRVIIPEKLLGRDPFSTTRGFDWSADGRRIAFSALGGDAAFKGSFGPDSVFQDRGRHCDVWLAAADGKYARRIGHGSRPHFSPDGKTLIALDRYDERFDTCIRRYDLTGKQPTSRVIIDSARAACFGRGPNELAVVLTTGDLVLTDLNGHITQRVLAAKDIVPPEMGGKLDQLRAALIDW